jgi:predicted dinucleotide-binding enzyme
MRISVLGTGMVGQALAGKRAAHGYEVIGTRRVRALKPMRTYSPRS